MPAVRLGPMHLRWCDACNVPVLGSKHCDICDSGTRPVQVTPPGDIRPAFPADIVRVRAAIASQFGDVAAASLLPEGHIVLLNRSPHMDRMDEVVVDGRTIGNLRYDLDKKGYTFLPSVSAGRVLADKATRCTLTADKGAVRPIAKGGSLLGPGVVRADDGIKVGDELIIKGPGGQFLAAGRSRMDTQSLRSLGKGVAVRPRVKDKGAEDTSSKVNKVPATWDDVLKANSSEVLRRRRKGVEFIKRTIDGQGLPVAVSISGGKDSLATLLLVLEADVRPKVLFIDTGLELPETIENVKRTAERFDLELITTSAGERFWTSFRYFGPPAKDYRWCCKTCKLGPVTGIINDNFPEGALVFIGQRMYESVQRAGKGHVWRNPWVPGQVGASPIQDWTSLHVWLLIFSRGEDIDVNPWYGRGLDRVGCWLCPASDIADLEVIKRHFPGYPRWEAALREYAERTGHDDEWLASHLWRWRRVPKGLKEMSEHFRPGKGRGEDPTGPLMFHSTEGYQPCVGGYSIEGAFNRPIDLERVEGFLSTLGMTERRSDPGSICVGNDIEVWGQGALVITGTTKEAAGTALKRVTRAIARAEDCVGCGICIARCEKGTISRDPATGRATIDISKCDHCGTCDDVCPITDLDPGQEFEL